MRLLTLLSIKLKEENPANVINGDAPGAMATVAELAIPWFTSQRTMSDGTGQLPWSVADAPNPKNAYGRSKRKGEQAVIASGCVHAILRTSWVVSAHGNNLLNNARLSEIKDQIALLMIK